MSLYLSLPPSACVNHFSILFSTSVLGIPSHSTFLPNPKRQGTESNEAIGHQLLEGGIHGEVGGLCIWQRLQIHGGPGRFAEKEVADLVVVWQRIHPHIREEEFDLLHCSLGGVPRIPKVSGLHNCFHIYRSKSKMKDLARNLTFQLQACLNLSCRKSKSQPVRIVFQQPTISVPSRCHCHAAHSAAHPARSAPGGCRGAAAGPGGPRGRPWVASARWRLPNDTGPWHSRGRCWLPWPGDQLCDFDDFGWERLISFEKNCREQLQRNP